MAEEVVNNIGQVQGGEVDDGGSTAVKRVGKFAAMSLTAACLFSGFSPINQVIATAATVSVIEGCCKVYKLYHEAQ